jgi:hypothetical protein
LGCIGFPGRGAAPEAGTGTLAMGFLHEKFTVTPATLALNVYITHTGCTLATVSGFRFEKFLQQDTQRMDRK